MLPFGPTVRRWRMERGLSQDALARASRVPRPNLSRIESGRAEVSLRTIRALALALEVTPGTLVDGRPPDAGAALSRAALERIAAAAVTRRVLPDVRENTLALHLAALIRPQLRSMGRRPAGPRRLTRRARAAWLALADHSPHIAHSLIQRALERARRL